jgi:hypothetical protein
MNMLLALLRAMLEVLEIDERHGLLPREVLWSVKE